MEIFKPALDTRYSEEDVVSHDQNSIRSTPIESSGKPIADFAGLYGVTVILRMPAIDWCLLYVASAALLGYVVGSFAAKDAITRVLRHQP